jgi:membrane protein DedA with SNARE-associated domain
LRVFDFLTHLIDGSPASYAAIAAVVALDSFFPLVPGETAVITGGVLAANGDLSLPLVLLAAWAGGLIGDNLNYLLGRSVGVRVRRRLFTSDKALHNLAWAEVQLEKHGTPIILVARFVPGGRTATMFSAGSLEMAWRSFLSADAIATGVWAAYAAGLGFVGGSTFSHSLWKPLVIATIIAVLVTAASEVYRRRCMDEDRRRILRRKRKFRREAEAQSRP